MIRAIKQQEHQSSKELRIKAWDEFVTIKKEYHLQLALERYLSDLLPNEYRD
jgi:hypothetical protein